MSDAPVISHTEAIHITATSSATLSDSNKLEETSKVEIDDESVTQDRMNLNSDGHTLVGATWRSLSGSMDFLAVRTSTVQGTILTAKATNTSAFLTKITNASAGATEVKGYRYEIVFEKVGEIHEASKYVSGSASFKVSGAPFKIMGS